MQEASASKAMSPGSSLKRIYRFFIYSVLLTVFIFCICILLRKYTSMSIFTSLFFDGLVSTAVGLMVFMIAMVVEFIKLTLTSIDEQMEQQS